MLVASASLQNIPVVILDVGAHAPAKQIVAPTEPHLAHVDGSFSDPQRIRDLAAEVNVLTAEIEVQYKGDIEVHPSPSTVRIIRDKFRQKEHLRSHTLPEPTAQAIKDAAASLGLPLMLKSNTLAYNGAETLPSKTFCSERPLYAEKWVPFISEIAVMVVRRANLSLAGVETVHKNNICHLVFAPLRSPDHQIALRTQDITERGCQISKRRWRAWSRVFLLEDGASHLGTLGPYTIEACETSQYENHLRAILSLPIGSTSLKVTSAAMLNILGSSNDMSELTGFAEFALGVPGASVHLFGKAECRKGRKMGHITLTANSDAEIRARLRELLQRLPGGSAPTSICTRLWHPTRQPVIGVIMGSDSDLSVMLPATRMLDRFRVPYELTIVSAHRTLDRLVEYARPAAARGLRVIVAGAGGAAHLPGMVVAMTAQPVIGVPVKGSSRDGVDSLHSIVQMPRDIPMATVAINNGTNTGLLASHPRCG
ncbi:AIR carboxylase-domain-containing protein [Russula brevipes]|nr:AIR carboxylase-domain-containing protein [Russula brevipes]